MITALDVHRVTEDLPDHIATRHTPIFASSRNGGPERCTVRLVLTDLRRIDITVASAAGREPRLSAATGPELGQALETLAEEFGFLSEC